MDEQSKTPPETTEEKLDRLQHYYGIRPGSVGSGTPDIFEVLPEEKRPVFRFKVMSATDQQKFNDDFYEGSKLSESKRDQAVRFIIDNFLTGWDNYSDRDGLPVPFESKDGKITEECYASLALPMRSAVFAMILTRNTLTKKESAAVK